MPETMCVILRKTPFRESSLAVASLTADFGRVDFILRGALEVKKRKFPEAGLFREFYLSFREPKNADGLASVFSLDPAAEHDRVSLHPENYLALCSFAKFLLRHTRPMLPVPLSCTALRTLLTRLENAPEPEPWLSLARFVFLRENGFVPQEEEMHADRVRKLLRAALDPAVELPPGRESYWESFRVWLDNLCVWNDLS